MTLVSVITPCWNGEGFLDTYFQNLLRQTHDEIEVVFVDDGSTDRSAAICESYGPALHGRGYDFIYLRQANQGAAAAVKSGLEHASGEHLLLCDVDDKLMPNAVEAMSSFLDKHGEFGLVRCNGRYEFSERQDRSGALFVTSRREKEQQEIFESLLVGDTNNWPGSYMVRSLLLREQMGDRPMFTSRFGQNLQILLPVAFRYRAGFIDLPLMRYVVRQGSHSHPVEKTLGRTIEFSRGYEEIRLGILRTLEMPAVERRSYERLVRERFARRRADLALRTGRPDLFEPEYATLFELGAVTPWDRMQRWLVSGALRRPTRAAARVWRCGSRISRALRRRAAGALGAISG